MITRSILTTALLLSCIISFSQTTNTKKWRKTENDSMQNALLLYEEGNYLLALPIYEKLYTAHPKEEYLKYCYGKCALQRSDKHEVALTLLTEVYAQNPKVDNIEYDLARANHYNYKFDEALGFIEKIMANKRTSVETKTAAKQLKNYCINAKEFYAHPTGAQIKNAGNILNTEFDEYVPVISADESIMVFTYRGKESNGGLQNAYQQPDPNGIYYEDVFESVKENDQWTTPRPIKSINSNSHDAAIALSSDGMTLFSYKDSGDDHGDIYMSTMVNGEWTAPQKLKGQVNSYSWEGSCSMTADGKQLYFTSERGGGFGGRDIYRATLLTDSTWGHVINLGDSINTALDDDAPFIHPDGVTLFYSSKGRNSMGDYDIFQTRLNWLDSTFSNPVNLGYPINTPDGDRFYVLSANSERGYYASGKTGGSGLQDIYTVYPGYVGKKPSLYLVKGKITHDMKPVAADITVEVTSRDNKKFGSFSSNSANGNYLVSLPAGAVFKLTYSYKSLPYKTLEVNTTNVDGYEEKIFDVNFESVPDTAKPLVAKEPVAVKEPVKKEPEAKPIIPIKKDTFVATKAIHNKTTMYAEKYGNITAEGLVFKVQIAAYKYPKNYVYEHLKGLGNVDNFLLDGITRITIGGDFVNLGTAWEHCKKVITAGQTDAFVTVLYKGKRIYLEELEAIGIFVSKPQ
jgi:hypothetical protein